MGFWERNQWSSSHWNRKIYTKANVADADGNIPVRAFTIPNAASGQNYTWMVKL